MQMVNTLNRSLLAIILFSILVACDKEEVETNSPAIEAPATFELYKNEIGAVEVYAKNGRVTGVPS
ncbi:hypothetical protein [Pontibacter amylolyticus]|uniref:Uncharacterized protein n=1 Tax=Pontibacter amylolyticus TaxID=1424080 RepID=A0ABQ1W9A6_9BACT|nr:hypothetical protein [Pontibacter amylolyticus]GGG20378.1 hypothetical protein GCM10011323_25560 [Pontibacter amylolyticus]